MVPDPARSRFPGTPHIAGLSSHHREVLAGDWTLLRVAPGAVTSPSGLGEATGAWLPAMVPGTVASAARANGTLPELEQVEDYDASDWWYCCRFSAPAIGVGEEAWLRFEGLATLAEVWLNDQPLGTSENMFQELQVRLGPHLRRENVLHIRFRSLRSELERRRPRPHWRTGLVEHQQLRWFRTTLLGRMPGWSPPVRAVGPWRPVWLEVRRIVTGVEGDVMPRFGNGRASVDAELDIQLADGVRAERAALHVAGSTHALQLTTSAGSVRLAGTFPVPGAESWWPHTHGSQPRYAAHITLETSAGPVQIDLGQVAFRSITIDQRDGGFRVLVNDVPVFCRGACWTSCDIVSLRPTDAQLDRTLGLAREAGMNMLRVGGTMVYEDSRFHDTCDALGIMVWQDFMYANMDYPAGDETFLTGATGEAAAMIAQRRRFASTAIWCGGSEVEQQAAMLGLPAEQWTNPLFNEVLPALCASAGAGVAYVRNSPTGGPLPFTVNTGVSHYYGVGAYLRPLDDARRAGVRFTSETLGFANVPEPATLESLLKPGEIPPHHPRWKSRVPRDTGAGWDFDDVRDHYLKLQFGLDPVQLRYADVERYLALSRVVTGDVMARTFGEWRSGGTCWGGLVWFLQDLWTGAGWGVIDAMGRPKAAWQYLRRAFAPLAVFLTDEGLNGIDVHIINDAAAPVEGTLRFNVYRDGGIPVARGDQEVRVEGRSRIRLSGDGLVGRFTDLTGAYRFGPPGHDVVTAELVSHPGQQLLAKDLLLTQGLFTGRAHDPALTGRVVRLTDTEAEIELSSERLAYAVAIDAGKWEALGSAVHVFPAGRATILLRGAAADRPASVEAVSLNGGRCRIRMAESPSG